MSGRKNRSKKSAAAAAQGQSKLTFGLTGAITFGTDDARKAKRPKVRSAEQMSQGVNASSNMRGMSATGSTVPGSEKIKVKQAVSGALLLALHLCRCMLAGIAGVLV